MYPKDDKRQLHMHQLFLQISSGQPNSSSLSQAFKARDVNVTWDIFLTCDSAKNPL